MIPETDPEEIQDGLSDISKTPQQWVDAVMNEYWRSWSCIPFFCVAIDIIGFVMGLRDSVVVKSIGNA